MNLDDQLRSAAADVRSELSNAETPAFQPPSPTGSRVALLALVAFVVGGGWWLLRPSEDAEPFTEVTADRTTIQPPEPEEQSSGLQPPADRSAGIAGFDEVPTSPMVQPSSDSYVIEPDTGVAIRELVSTAGVVQPVFSRTQAYNADGSLVLLYRTRDASAATGHLVADAETGQIVAELDLSEASDIENISWDGSDPSILYFTVGAELRRFDVNSARSETVSTCESTDGTGSFDSPSTAGSTTTGTSLIGLMCRQANGDVIWSAYDTATQTMTNAVAAGVDAVPLPLASNAGFVAVGETEVFVLDPDLTVVRSVAIEASVFTVAQDADGSDVLVATVFAGPTGDGTVVVVDLARGSTQVVVGPDTGAPYPPSGTQLSTAATNRPNLVAISTFSDQSGPLTNEIMLLELDGANTQLRRLAHHRSEDNRADDWPATPMVAISPDGDRVLFSSNWGTDVISTFEIALP